MSMGRWQKSVHRRNHEYVGESSGRILCVVHHDTELRVKTDGRNAEWGIDRDG